MQYSCKLSRVKTGAFGQFANVFPMGGVICIAHVIRGILRKKNFHTIVMSSKFTKVYILESFLLYDTYLPFKNKKKEVFSTLWENVRMVMAW